MGLFNKWFGKPKYWVINEVFKGNKRPTTDYSQFGIKKFDFEKYVQKNAYAIANNPQIKQAVTGIAGQSMGEGTFVIPAERRNKEGILITNDRSRKALNLIEQLNRRMNITKLIFDSTLRMMSYGTDFLEITLSPVFNTQIINPRNQPFLQPLFHKGSYNIAKWTTNTRDPDKGITYAPSEIVVLPWNPDINWPYGTSFLSGIEAEIRALADLRMSAMEYARKNAFPFDVVQVGDSEFQPGETTMNTFRSSIQNREAGGVQITNAPVTGYPVGAGGKGVDFITDQMKFHRDQLSDGLIAPPLSKLYDSTEASAKVTQKWVREVLINPIHEIYRTKIEREIYTPYLLSKGFSVRNVPQLMFNISESMRSDEINSIVALVGAETMTPEQASRELGFDYDEAFWEKKKRDEVKLAQVDREKKEAQPKEDKEKPQPKEAA